MTRWISGWLFPGGGWSLKSTTTVPEGGGAGPGSGVATARTGEEEVSMPGTLHLVDAQPVSFEFVSSETFGRGSAIDAARVPYRGERLSPDGRRCLSERPQEIGRSEFERSPVLVFRLDYRRGRQGRSYDIGLADPF